MSKYDTIPILEKSIPKEATPLFWDKVYSKGNKNEKTQGYDNSQSETDGCVINLSKEHENEEDEAFKEDTYEINDTNE